MKSPDLRQRKVQALPSEPLRPVLTFYTTQNTITSRSRPPLTFERHPTTCFCVRFQSTCSLPPSQTSSQFALFALFSPFFFFLASRTSVYILTIPSTSSVWRCLLSLRFLPLPTMPFGQMSDPLLCAVCSSLLFLSVRLQSAALWSS